MFISLAVLFLLVLACMSLGACAGMVVVALCRVSAEESRREEAEGLKESY